MFRSWASQTVLWKQYIFSYQFRCFADHVYATKVAWWFRLGSYQKPETSLEKCWRPCWPDSSFKVAGRNFFFLPFYLLDFVIEQTFKLWVSLHTMAFSPPLPSTLLRRDLSCLTGFSNVQYFKPTQYHCHTIKLVNTDGRYCLAYKFSDISFSVCCTSASNIYGNNIWLKIYQCDYSLIVQFSVVLAS